MKDKQNQGLIFAALAYTAWGLLGPIGKELLKEMEPLELNAWRMFLATAVVGIMFRDSWGKAFKLLRNKWLVVTVLIGGGVDFTIYIYSVERLDPGLATLGFFTAPLWTGLLGLFFGEKLGRPWLIGITAMLVGGALALRPDATAVWDSFGMFLAVLSGFGWAVYAVGLRLHAKNVEFKPLILLSFTLATIYFVVLATLFEPTANWGGYSGKTWAWMALHVLVPTTFSMLLYNRSLQLAPATLVNSLVGLELAASFLFAAILSGSRYDWVTLFGILIVLAGVSWYVASGRRQKPAVTPDIAA